MTRLQKGDSDISLFNNHKMYLTSHSKWVSGVNLFANQESI